MPNHPIIAAENIALTSWLRWTRSEANADELWIQMSDVKPSPQFKLPPADLKKYLISLGWLDEESLPTKGEDRAKAMAPLLDLDLSVSIAQMLESPPVAQLVATDFALVGAQTDLLFETIQTAMDNYDFAIRHWERGRYRVLYGERLGRTLVSEGYGNDASNERWQRVGRLIWASAQEFVDTQFKRTCMKFRVVSDEQRPKLEAEVQWTSMARSAR